jgi:predicted nucleic acid-binding protein
VKVCVDTVILIDILKDESRALQSNFYNALYARETLIAPVVVFAELMPQFGGDAEQVAEFLFEHKISVAPLDIEAVSLAGARWLRYLKQKTYAKCPSCGQKLERKEHFLSDFYIGGFALARCDAILTRDRGIYGKYFADLPLYSPAVRR